MNFEVRLRINEDTETLIKRFIRKTKNSKLFEEISERRFYKKPSEIKREIHFKHKLNQKRLKEKMLELEKFEDR